VMWPRKLSALNPLLHLVIKYPCFIGADLTTGLSHTGALGLSPVTPKIPKTRILYFKGVQVVSHCTILYQDFKNFTGTPRAFSFNVV